MTRTTHHPLYFFTLGGIPWTWSTADVESIPSLALVCWTRHIFRLLHDQFLACSPSSPFVHIILPCYVNVPFSLQPSSLLQSETDITNKKFFFVYQRGVSANNYTIVNFFTDYIQMLKTVQIVAMLKISKRQSPAAVPFWCCSKVSIFLYRLHRDWCGI